MYILIGADVVPTKSNIGMFRTGEVRELIGRELSEILLAADFRIFNLEVPLTNQKSPIIKHGPNLIAPTWSVKGYKNLNADLLTLANNHILDQDEQGLRSTIETLEKSGISHVGSGINLTEASRPFAFRFAGRRIGVYACAEHEFSIAGDRKAGANPFDPLYSLDHIGELRKNSDYVIVLYHGGKEHYPYPSPNLQRICRRMVDKGADCVICQHSHCIGCEEKYKEGTIIYGQGNFIFDGSDDPCWQTSLLIKLDDNFNLSYLPLAKFRNGVRLADGDKGGKILYDFERRTQEIKERSFVQEQYLQFADEFQQYYLQALAGKKSLLFRIINRISEGMHMKRYLMHTYNRDCFVAISNYIDCEAHRELLSQMLANRYDRKESR